MTKRLQGHQMVAVIHDDFFQHFVLCDAIHNGQKCVHDFEVDENYGWGDYVGPNDCPFVEQVNGMSDFAAYRRIGESNSSYMASPYTLFETKVTVDNSDSNLKVREDPNGQETFALVTKNEYVELQIDKVYVDRIDLPISFMSVVPIVWTEEPDYMPLWEFSGEKKIYRPTDPEWDKIMSRSFKG